MAKNPYNFKNLVTDPESGYKTYSDTKKHISSKLGVDVSEFQGEDTDWQQVKESGIDFVIVRLGYRATERVVFWYWMICLTKMCRVHCQPAWK